MPPPTPSEREIADAARALRDGGLVCVPTESTYGLAADIRVPAALDALVAIKGRDPRSPFALIAADLDSARSVAASWPARADALAARHWPGPLTLVVPARADLPACLIGPGGGVGVRVSSHPVAAALARAIGGPITATSANPAGLPPATDVAAARAYFGDADARGGGNAADGSARIAAYLDAGPARGVASTVAAIGADGRVTVLRPGPISLDDRDDRDDDGP
jgi:L-threonylcarbamoyladenylate synthase